MKRASSEGANQSLPDDEARRLLADYGMGRWRMGYMEAAHSCKKSVLACVCDDAKVWRAKQKQSSTARERILALLTGRPDTIASGEFEE